MKRTLIAALLIALLTVPALAQRSRSPRGQNERQGASSGQAQPREHAQPRQSEPRQSEPQAQPRPRESTPQAQPQPRESRPREQAEPRQSQPQERQAQRERNTPRTEPNERNTRTRPSDVEPRSYARPRPFFNTPNTRRGSLRGDHSTLRFYRYGRYRGSLRHPFYYYPYEYDSFYPYSYYTNNGYTLVKFNIVPNVGDAEIFVDGEYYVGTVRDFSGFWKAGLVIAPGPHSFLITYQGVGELTIDVYVQAGRTTTLHGALR